MQRSSVIFHLKYMNIIYRLLILAILASSCDIGSYCTMEFRSIGFTWTSTASTPDSVFVKNIRTGEPMQITSEAYNLFYPIADDNSMGQLHPNGDSLAVEVYNENDSLLANAWFVVGKDDCHIIFYSGPEFLP